RRAGQVRRAHRGRCGRGGRRRRRGGVSPTRARIRGRGSCLEPYGNADTPPPISQGEIGGGVSAVFTVRCAAGRGCGGGRTRGGGVYSTGRPYLANSSSMASWLGPAGSGPCRSRSSKNSAPVSAA